MKGSQTIRIAGYASSDGMVADYVVKLIGHEGYLDLVRKSLELLKSGKLSVFPGCSADEWAAAVREQTDSWTKTLQGESTRSGTTALRPSPDGYFTDPAKPDMVVVKNMLEISKEVVIPSDKRASVSAPKTLAKKHIAKQCPIEKFNGQMNLAPNKFVDIEVAE